MAPPISTNPALPLPVPPTEMLSKQAEQVLRQKREQQARAVKESNRSEKEEGGGAKPKQEKTGRGELVDRTA